MQIEEFLRDSAKRLGNPTALIAGDGRLSHTELDQLSDRMAAALAAHGIEPGDRVLVFMENSWEAVVSTFAVLKAGAVVTPVKPMATVGELALLVNDSRATGLITQAPLAGVAAATMAETPSLRLTVISGCRGAPVIDGILRFEDAISDGTAIAGMPVTERSSAAA
jgi:long-chain acyl-CoA synthetase